MSDSVLEVAARAISRLPHSDVNVRFNDLDVDNSERAALLAEEVGTIATLLRESRIYLSDLDNGMLKARLTMLIAMAWEWAEKC